MSRASVSVPSHHPEALGILLAYTGVRLLITSFIGPTESVKGLYATCHQLYSIVPIGSHTAPQTFYRNGVLLWPTSADDRLHEGLCEYVAMPEDIILLDTIFITCLHNPRSLKSRNASEETPLLVASKYGRVRTIRLLLLLEEKLLRCIRETDESPLVDDLDNCGRNGLHLCPDPEGIRTLLDAGCDVFKIDDLQRLPIAWAQRRGADPEVMELLGDAMEKRHRHSSRRQIGCIPIEGCTVQ